MGYRFESYFKYLFFLEQVSEQSEHLLPEHLLPKKKTSRERGGL